MNFTLGTFPEQGNISSQKELMELPYFSWSQSYYWVTDHPCQLDRRIQPHFPLASWCIHFNENLRLLHTHWRLTKELKSRPKLHVPSYASPTQSWQQSGQSGFKPVIRDPLRQNKWPSMPLRTWILKAQAEFNVHPQGQASAKVGKGDSGTLTALGIYWIFSVCQKLFLRRGASFPKSIFLSCHSHNFSAYVFMRRSSKCQIRVMAPRPNTSECNCLVSIWCDYREEVKGWRIKAAVNTELGLHTSHRLMYSMISRKLKLLHTHTHFSEIQTSSAPSGASFLLPFSVYRCGPHSPPHLSSDLILNLDFAVSYSNHLSHTFNTSMGLPEGFHGDAKVY